MNSQPIRVPRVLDVIWDGFNLLAFHAQDGVGAIDRVLFSRMRLHIGLDLLARVTPSDTITPRRDRLRAVNGLFSSIRSKRAPLIIRSLLRSAFRVER